MVCLDTDFIAELDRGKTDALAKLDELELANETIYTTSINAAELFHGAYAAHDSKRAVTDIITILDKFHILNLDYDSARMWGTLVVRLKTNSIGELDLFIASIAISNKQKLITRNKKHFERVPGLQVEGW
jgi:tRNA(fMet)-specific endonuclease VapC